MLGADRIIVGMLIVNAAATCAELPLSGLERGLAEARKGDCQAALIDLRMALSHSPNAIPALNAVGLCESILSHPERARANFERVVKLQPQAWQAWNNLGANYLALHLAADAERAFRRAVALAPDAGSAWFNLASTLLQEGNKLDAFRALDRAQQNDSNDAQLNHAWLNLAAAVAAEAADEIEKRAYPSAYAKLSLIQRALQKSPSWNNLIGYAEFKLNKDEDARRHLQAALQEDPDNEDYLLDVGEFLAAHHAYKEAGEFFEIGAKRMPGSPRVRFGVAIAYILQDRRDEATESLERLLSEYPGWEPVYRALGECYEDAGKWAALIQLGQALQTTNPTTAAGWYFEGVGQERLSIQNGTPMNAVDMLQRASTLDPSSSRYHFELGKAYAEANDASAAVHELKEALRLDPDHQRAHYVLARVYQRLGQTQLANLEFQAHSRIKARGEKDAYVTMLTASQHSHPDPQVSTAK